MGEGGISAMYAVGDAHNTCHLWVIKEHCHVSSGGRSVRYVPSWGWGRGGKEHLGLVCSGARSVTHAPSGGWKKGGRSLACTHRVIVSQICLSFFYIRQNDPSTLSIV